MKLFTKEEVHSGVKEDNERLKAENHHLQLVNRSLNKRLDRTRSNFSQDRVQAQQQYEEFQNEIARKKSQLLEELITIQKEIKKERDLYYGLIAKQDSLDERLHDIEERETKLKMRESYVEELEKKISEHGKKLQQTKLQEGTH